MIADVLQEAVQDKYNQLNTTPNLHLYTNISLIIQIYHLISVYHVQGINIQLRIVYIT